MWSSRPLCDQLSLRSCFPSIPSHVLRPQILVSRRKCPRSFHSSPRHQRPRRSKYPSITQAQLDRIQAERKLKAEYDQVPLDQYKSYTEEELKKLARWYSPEQMAAIKAAEEAISKYDLATQGKLRRDPLQFQYLDDFSRIEQTIDKKVEKLRGHEQEYRDKPMVYPTSHFLLEEALMQGKAAEEIDPENFGEWVRAPPANVEEQVDSDKGIFNKLILKRSMAQVGKAALKRYLNVSTFKEAQAYCEAKDHEEALRTATKRKAATGDKTPATTDELLIDDSPNENLPTDPRHPLHSAYFQATIVHDPKYKECYQWAKDNPPPKTPFGMSALEAREDELLHSFPDVAPGIPKLDSGRSEADSSATAATAAADQETSRLFIEAETQGLGEEETHMMIRVARELNIPISKLRKIRVKNLSANRVSNQTMLGKVPSMYFLSVAGNGAGMVGLGEGKALEPSKARLMAKMNAIKNMAPVLRYENRTIYGEVYGKVAAAEVLLSARKPGFGVRATRHVFEIAKCAGIHDLSAKCLRSRNPMNVAKAVWEALKSQKHPDDIARARGKKLVDVRKVYYSGRV